MNIPLSESIPYYNSDFTKGIITLRGVSIDDDVKDFYTSIINDIKLNLPSYNKNIKIEIDLIFFNTRTSRYLMDILNIFKNYQYGVVVDWYYEEDDFDMCETANDYQSIIGIPFNTISKKPNSDLNYF